MFNPYLILIFMVVSAIFGHAFANLRVVEFKDSFGICPGSRFDSVFVKQHENVGEESLVENLKLELDSLVNKIPLWLDYPCQSAMRKYLCSRIYVSPVVFNVSDIFPSLSIDDIESVLPVTDSATRNSGNILLPSIANKNICLDYEAKCAKFIKWKNDPYYSPECTSWSEREIERVPVVVSVKERFLEAAVDIPTDIMSDSHLDATSTTICPSVLVIPEHPDYDYIEWAGPSGCAVGCKSPIWSDQEWEIFEWVEHIAAFLGLIPGFLTTMTWTFNRERRRQYLVTLLMWLQPQVASHSDTSEAWFTAGQSSRWTCGLSFFLLSVSLSSDFSLCFLWF